MWKHAEFAVPRQPVFALGLRRARFALWAPRGCATRSPKGEAWCPGAESNHRHCDFQSHALPTELPGHAARPQGPASRRVIVGLGRPVHPPKPVEMMVF